MYQVYEKYGVRLVRVNQNHLEMVRNWRNSDFVRTKMLFQDYITPEMQERWFHTINNDNNLYFIIQYNDESVGVINIKDIANNIGEPGFYLSDIKYSETPIASLAYFALLDFAFNVLLLSKVYIHVRRDNPESLKFNLFFDYKMIEEKSTDKFYFLELERADFLKNKKVEKLVKYLSKNANL